MTVKVSVVMPVYNSERFIAEAVESVLASRFTDFELLVLDDGSTDASIAEATVAAAGDARLRVVHLPHGGVGAARNAGLSEARGEYIANLDSDDAMFPDRLARQVAFLDAHPECVAVGSRSVNVSADGRPTSISGRYFTHEAIDAALLGGDGGAIGNDGAMFRRDVARAAGGYAADLRTSGEDHDLWLRLAEVGRLAVLPAVLTRYRIHDRNSSLGEGSRDRRLPVTLDNLARAFARRGIVDREPAKLARPATPAWERLADDGLMAWCARGRMAALRPVLLAVVLNPRAPMTRGALRTILGGAAPRWPSRDEIHGRIHARGR